uniref:hypothetical protein n=1 Tax=uncultured Bilophila sp. TaxID=529385 RepID=UPI0025FD827F|nr:hypothetical protein [uncultured Bilophila sp.]
MPDTTVEVNALWRISLSADKKFPRSVLTFLKGKRRCKQCALNVLFSLYGLSKETARRMQVFPFKSRKTTNTRPGIAQKDNEPFFGALYLVWSFNQ